MYKQCKYKNYIKTIKNKTKTKTTNHTTVIKVYGTRTTTRNDYWCRPHMETDWSDGAAAPATNSRPVAVGSDRRDCMPKWTDGPPSPGRCCATESKNDCRRRRPNAWWLRLGGFGGFMMWWWWWFERKSWFDVDILVVVVESFGSSWRLGKVVVVGGLLYECWAIGECEREREWWWLWSGGGVCKLNRAILVGFVCVSGVWLWKR